MGLLNTTIYNNVRPIHQLGGWGNIGIEAGRMTSHVRQLIG